METYSLIDTRNPERTAIESEEPVFIRDIVRLLDPYDAANFARLTYQSPDGERTLTGPDLLAWAQNDDETGHHPTQER